MDRRLIRISIVVAALVVVPALLRAAQPVDGGLTTAQMRLNRGFAAPESKCRLPQPVDTLLSQSSFEEPAVPYIGPRTPVLDDTVPDSPRDASPDTLRGPPASLLF